MYRKATLWIGIVALGLMLVSCSSEEAEPADEETAVVEDNTNTNKGSLPPAESDSVNDPLLQEPDSNAVQEPQVDHQAEQSPDGRYRIETFGVNDAITAAGLYPAAEIRLVDTSSEEVKWSTHGYYRQRFLWSPDSRYTAVYAESRTHGETFLVDVEAMDAIQLPNMDAVMPYWEGEAMTENEYLRHDPYFWHVNWLDNERIQIAFEWNGSGDDRYSGTYEYSVSARELLAVEWD